MESVFELAIVIPAYNEEKRLSLRKYLSFIKTHKHVMLCFVNDGSTDNTSLVLENLRFSSHKNVRVISLNKNRGKAYAVQTGVAYCIKHSSCKNIAFLDADLSTSLSECYRLSQHVNSETQFVFGSRIRKLDSFIRRNHFRFIIGRFVATLISGQLDLNVYDTQCGCKLFSKDLASIVFKTKFVSTWLFDVEIFHRILNHYGKQRLIRITKEILLRSWIDKNHSKVSLFYAFKLWFELLIIRKKYRKPHTRIEPQFAIHEVIA